ncbi:MAG TPA: HAMP domain-containing protein [Rhodospirillaceae bacterium]|nr:HAMP domain-containing protein [Rhodospirillaceae bacterium]
MRRLPFAAMIKSVLPKGLLGRSLLILVTPMALLQLVSAYVFYGTHWDMVTRRLSTGLAGDIGAVIEMMRSYPGEDNRARIFETARSTMDLRLTLKEGEVLERTGMLGGRPFLSGWLSGYSLEDNLVGALAERVGRPVFIDAETYERDIVFDVQMPSAVLEVRASRKRLYSPTTMIFTLWMVGTSLLLVAVATIFMRNQVRAVRRLAAAADAFGKGREVPYFKPEGAAEVRQAAAAFRMMQERIRRQVDQRTEMLAGVSHDLKTPLTRMKLELAMMKGDGIGDLLGDVAEMEGMVEGYLAFARGEAGEKVDFNDLSELMREVAGKCRREGREIALTCEDQLVLPLKPQAISRCLANLIGNAVRYAGQVVVQAGRQGHAVEVIIDDDGPGIPEDKRKEVFRAFYRLEGSRNPKTGGVGLGLTIARDVVRGHGGEIFLEDSPLGGLRVRLRLPL